jgi:GT2 family glycosyltransferase
MIIVHYGDVRPTLSLLESLAALDHFAELDVLVVNNDPRENLRSTLYPLIRRASNIELIEPLTNRGYFGGAKLGIERYRPDRGSLPSWVIITNNDVVIEDQLFLEKLLSRNPQEVGVIAPRILSTMTQSDHNPYMRRRPGRLRVAELRFWLTNYHLAGLHEYLSRWKRAFRGRIRLSELNEHNAGQISPEPIYAPHGSFLILSREFFDRGGYIDDGCFLYAEEVSVAEACRRVGLPAVYQPELIVLHTEHSTTGRKFSRTTYERQKQALEYLTDRYLSDVG